MSTFLISNKNLKDIVNIEEARDNLELGNIALQNSNNVHITGGKISAHTISVQNPDISEGAFAISLDEHGTIGFSNLNLPSWIEHDSGKIKLSTFNNDINFVASNDLQEVCFTGNYFDLQDIPTSTQLKEFADLFVDKSAFLLVENNLSELSEHAMEVGKNLGLGTMAYQNDTFVTVSNLTIRNEFRFYGGDSYSCNDDLYLGVDELNKALWKPLPIADTTKPGLILLSDNYLETSANTPPKAASVVALKNAYDDLDRKIKEIDELDTQVDELIQELGLISIETISISDYMQNALRRELGIGTLALQNADNVTIDNLEVSGNLKLRNDSSSGFLSRDTNGYVHIISEEDLKATEQKLGLVRITNSIEINDAVPTTQAVREQVTFLSNEINGLLDGLSDIVIEQIVEDNSSYLLKTFQNINRDEALQNLNLPRVAITGDYNDLTNRILSVDELESSCNLLKVDNNLSDIIDAARSRDNLRLGSMSTQNSNDVNIVNGIANFQTITVTDKFTYKHHVTIPEGEQLFLKCINIAGVAEWGGLPVATESTYGVVKFTASIDDVDKTENSVISGFGFHKYYMNIISRIDALELSLTNDDRLTDIQQVIKKYNDKLQTLLIDESPF